MSKWTDEQAREAFDCVANPATRSGANELVAVGRRILDLEAKVAALSLTGNPNAVNCDGLPNTEHTLCAIIKTERCPACAALAEIAAMRPVVEAACQFRDSPPDDRYHLPLVSAVDAYRAQREGK